MQESYTTTETEVDFPRSCPAPTHLWAPLIYQNNSLHAPPGSFVSFLPRRKRTYGAQGQRSLWGRGGEMAPHASQDQLLTLLLEAEGHLQRDVTSQQQLAASSEVVRSCWLPEADDPSLPPPSPYPPTLELWPAANGSLSPAVWGWGRTSLTFNILSDRQVQGSVRTFNLNQQAAKPQTACCWVSGVPVATKSNTKLHQANAASAASELVCCIFSFCVLTSCFCFPWLSLQQLLEFTTGHAHS